MTRRRRKELRKKRVTTPAKHKVNRSTKTKEQECHDPRLVNYLAEEHPEF